jgi:uncharacterized protein with HEPN domain
MSPSAYEYPQHILDETAYIINSSDGLNKAAFMQDETLKRAYVRSIEIIGEAVKQLPIHYAKSMMQLNGAQWLECVTD